ncbi:MAG: aminotransferase class I/II-fold pyridoxal phosphate-dependent enzyme, partial [Francisellaceae bacterium]|nr:aminotransferase class I/II-fold pyridoxal phosphate-dependent enzyme [Francisellaceae bacterium]
CGVSSRSSSVVSGYQQFTHDLEAKLANFLGFDRCLIFSSGYMANLSIVQGLLNRGDVVIQDRDNHASLVDASILARAKLIRYEHLNYIDLVHLCSTHKNNIKIIMSDSVFSMTGEIVDVSRLIDAREQKCKSAKIMIDDSHGIAVLGASGEGILQEQNIIKQSVDILSFGLGKGFGVQGGVIASDYGTIENLINNARTYRFSTAISPILLGAIDVSLDIIREETWRRDCLMDLVIYFKRTANEYGLKLLDSSTPIQVIEYQNEYVSADICRHLQKEGLLVHPVAPPTVPVGVSRIRIILNVSHTQHEIHMLIKRIIFYEKIKI